METEHLIRRLYRVHLERLVEGFRRDRMAHLRRWASIPRPGAEPVEVDGIRENLAASHGALVDELETAEETGRLPKRIEDTAHELLGEAGETLHGEDFAYLCSELLRAERRAHVIAEREEAADRRGEPRPDDPELDAAPAPASNSPAPSQPATSGPEPAPSGPEATALSEVVALHVDERRGRSWGPRTAEDTESALAKFQAWIGPETPVGEVTRDTMRQYRDHLEGEKIPGGKLRSPTTVRRLFSHVSTLLNFAVGEGYIARNPAKGVKLPPKPQRRREAFSDEELQRIFARPYWHHSLWKGRPGWYWVPLVLLYTGARCNEIAQLDRCDIATIEGTHVLRIGSNGKQVKTAASVRDVPIHSGLVRLGFLEYVEKARRRRGKGTLLFEDLEASKGRKQGPGGSVSQFFRRHLRERAGITDHGKVMHGFRHTIQARLREARVEEYLIKAIVGHEDRGNMTTLYAGPPSLKLKAKALESIDFREALRYLRA